MKMLQEKNSSSMQQTISMEEVDMRGFFFFKSLYIRGQCVVGTNN